MVRFVIISVHKWQTDRPRSGRTLDDAPTWCWVCPPSFCIDPLIDRQHSSRQVKDLEFDLVLPGESTSPLKPRKSGRARQTPQPGLPSQKSPRPTPKQAETPSTNERRDAESNALSESIGDEDILGSDPTASRGKTINSRKRKLDRVGDSEEPTTKRKRRPAQNPRKGGNAAMQKDRTRKPRSTTKAAGRDALAHMGNTSPEDDTASDSQATSRVETVKVRKPGTKIPRKIVDSAAKVGRAPKLQQQPAKLSKKRTGNPEEMDLIKEAEPAVGLVDHEVIDEKESAAGERVPAMAPVKKPRKRKAIGQLLTKRARQPTHASPQNTVSASSNHSTSDLVNELLDSTINSSPKKPIKEPQQARNLVKSSKAMPSTNSQHLALDGPDLAVEGNDLTESTSIVSKPATAVSEQAAKPKSRKKRRSVTQVKKPRKRVAFGKNLQDEVLPRAPEVDAESDHVTIVSNIDTKSMGNHTGRNPLSNITNSIPDPVIARTKTDSTENSTQDPAAVEAKGRPRKNPPTAKNERSKSQTVVTKPDAKPTSAAALPTKPRTTTLNKIAKAPAKSIKKASKSSISVTAGNASTGSLVDDPALDSDDPLSGPSNVRFKKSLKPVDGFAAQVSSERNIQLTPQRKGSENRKRKELEQREIEMLLGSIGKGVRSGRAMAA